MSHPTEDEWFPAADPAASHDALRDSAHDSWLAGDDPVARRPVFDPWALADPHVLALIAVGIAFFAGLLAAFGAFGNDSSPPPAPSIGRPQPLTQVSGSRTAAPPATRTSPTPPTTTLTPGDSGTQVKALQRELVSLGYSVGAIDGAYGPATSKAVAAFQRAHHLPPDGIVGQATLLALAP